MLALRRSTRFQGGVSLVRQFSTFFAVGLAAVVAHYAALIGLVEAAHWRPVPATLVGYVAGGVVSYTLNRRHTFETERSHGQAGWRFAVVAGVGFVLTFAAMSLLVERLGAPYLPAQIATTGAVMTWSFLAHKFWSFADR